MRRKTFDRLLTAGGVVLTIVLLVAGGFLMWGYTFANNTVRNQLAAQQIYFPPQAAFAHPKAGGEITPSMIPSVSQYAGQQLVNGAQAEAYANDFIAVHLREIGGGQTYAQLSGKALADPTNTALANQVQTIFLGTTLRSMLLNAYGWWKMGQFALWGAIACFALAVVMGFLSILGWVHARRTEERQELFTEHAGVGSTSPAHA